MNKYYNELSIEEMQFHSLPILFSNSMEIRNNILPGDFIVVPGQANAISETHNNKDYRVGNLGKHISRTVLSFSINK